MASRLPLIAARGSPSAGAPLPLFSWPALLIRAACTSGAAAVGCLLCPCGHGCELHVALCMAMPQQARLWIECPSRPCRCAGWDAGAHAEHQHAVLQGGGGGVAAVTDTAAKFVLYVAETCACAYLKKKGFWTNENHSPYVNVVLPFSSWPTAKCSCMFSSITRPKKKSTDENTCT